MKKIPIFLATLFFLLSVSGFASASLITFNDLQPGQPTAEYGLDAILTAAGLFGLQNTISRHHVDSDPFPPLFNVRDGKKETFPNLDMTLTHYCDYDRRGDNLSNDETGFVEGPGNTDFIALCPKDRPDNDNGHDQEGTAPVPEPATLLLLSTGLLGAALTIRRKRTI